MSLVSSCLHKAAPHQIAFVLNIWIGARGPRAMARRDATEKRERERIQYPTSYAKATPLLQPGAGQRWRERGREGTRKGWIERRRIPRYTTQLVSSVFPSFRSQYSIPVDPPNESAFRPDLL
ncbi:hypothetical protein KM043_011416 [Ampulex compressa]|nr:hypothetical protein KM043_011416 [Ampulex compressa]